jgi:tRNA(Ile)-lysidine synthetase-like protein
MRGACPFEIPRPTVRTSGSRRWPRAVAAIAWCMTALAGASPAAVPPAERAAPAVAAAPSAAMQALAAAPADATAWIRVRDGQALFASPEARALASKFASALLDDAAGTRWAGLAARLGWTDVEAFDRLLGRDVRVVLRTGRGLPTDWALLTTISDDDMGHLVRSLRPSIGANARFELPEDSLRLAYRDGWLTIGPLPQAVAVPDADAPAATRRSLFDDLADRGAIPTEPPKDAVTLERALASRGIADIPPGRVSSAFRIGAPFEAACAVGADIVDGELKASVRGAFAEAPFPGLASAMLDISVLARFASTAIVASVDPISRDVAPDDAPLVAIVPEIVPHGTFRANLGERRLIVVGDLDGATRTRKSAMRVPEIAVAYEVDDAQQARDDQDAYVAKAYAAIVERFAKPAGIELGTPLDPRRRHPHRAHRSGARGLDRGPSADAVVVPVVAGRRGDGPRRCEDRVAGLCDRSRVAPHRERDAREGRGCGVGRRGERGLRVGRAARGAPALVGRRGRRVRRPQGQARGRRRVPRRHRTARLDRRALRSDALDGLGERRAARRRRPEGAAHPTRHDRRHDRRPRAEAVTNRPETRGPTSRRSYSGAMRPPTNQRRSRDDLMRDVARDPLTARVGAALVERCRRTADDARIVVGVSGGPDSTALAVMLAALAARRPGAFPEVVLVAVHHGLRDAADDECALVARLGRVLGVAAERVDIRPGARRGNVSANARTDRYAALRGAAERHDASLVATAHHADDRLETMLLALGRGRGLRGLAQPRWTRRLGGTVRLVRPCLGVTKAELVAFCERFDLDVAADPSNADPARGRGHLRRAVLPGLASRAPSIALHAGAAADEAALALAALEDAIGREFGDRTRWPRRLFEGRDPALAAWVLRRAARTIDADLAERVPRPRVGPGRPRRRARGHRARRQAA